MSAGSWVAANAKTVVSGISGAITVIGAVAALAEYAPAPVAGTAGALLTLAEVLRGANVWLVRNEPAIEAAADEGAVIVHDMSVHIDPAKAADAAATLAALERQRALKANTYLGAAKGAAAGSTPTLVAGSGGGGAGELVVKPPTDPEPPAAAAPAVVG